MGGSASKVYDVTALPSRHKMADMCYYGKVMTTTRWWLCVTILHLQQYSHRLNLVFIIIIGGILVLFIYITRLASNEIFSPSNKIHREVGRAKDLSAPLYRGADKSLARPGRKQATATEDFEFHLSYL